MKRNKSIIALVTAFTMFLSTSIMAQDCNLTKDEKDAFTGERIKMYKHVLINQGTIWSIQLDMHENQYAITIAPVIGGRTMLVATTGTTLLVKLGDGQIIPLII